MYAEHDPAVASVFTMHMFLVGEVSMESDIYATECRDHGCVPWHGDRVYDFWNNCRFLWTQTCSRDRHCIICFGRSALSCCTQCHLVCDFSLLGWHGPGGFYTDGSILSRIHADRETRPYTLQLPNVLVHWCMCGGVVGLGCDASFLLARSRHRLVCTVR